MDEYTIRRIVQKHYSGNIDSLLAQKMIAVGLDVAMAANNQFDDFYHDLFVLQRQRIWQLEYDLALARGETPPEPVAIA